MVVLPLAELTGWKHVYLQRLNAEGHQPQDHKSHVLVIHRLMVFVLMGIVVLLVGTGSKHVLLQRLDAEGHQP